MRRFVYAPDVSIYISTKNHGILDVSLDCIEGNVHRVLDAASTASFTLQNPRNKYIMDKKGEAIFRPMDRVVIFLTRIYKPMQVFSGYLDDVPYEQFAPTPVTFNATCTLKRLLYTYFDPSLSYTMQRLAKFGWAYDPTDGSLRDQSENFFDLDTGGGLGDLIRFMMHEVGGWEISDKPNKSNTVHVMPLPKSFIKKVATVMAKDMEEVDANRLNIEKILAAFMNSSGSESAGAPVTGGTNPDDNPVPPKFEGMYRGTIYGASILGGDSSGGGPKAQKVVKTAKEQLGDPYVWAAGGPESFDCSGLTKYCYQQIGIDLPHFAASQYSDSRGTAVARGALQPADLVFFHNLGHVGIYIGGNQFIHAPHTGDVVKISNIEGWYSDNYVGARRFIHETATTATGDVSYTYAQIEGFWIAAGGDPTMAPIMAAIAMAESTGRMGPGTLNDTPSTGDYSVGLWQINYFGSLRPGRIAAYGTPEELLVDPIKNAKAAVGISNNSMSGLGAWSTYPNPALSLLQTGVVPVMPDGSTGPGPSPRPDLVGEIGDVRVPTGFPLTSTFQISPNPFGNPQIVFRAVKTDPKLAQNQINIFVPGAIDDSTDQASAWHRAGIHDVVVDSSLNNGDGTPFDPSSPVTVEASASSLDITAHPKPYDPQQVIGESTDKFIDLYNIAQSQILGNSIIFPTAGDITEAETLSGQRALYNDIALMKWIETACTASGRRFQSRPDGDFLAFYPDYFGWANEELYSMPYMRIADLEIISGDITLSDQDLTTHYFTTADIEPDGQISMWDKMHTLVASVENSGAFKEFTNADDKFDFASFLKRYGARPYVDEQINIKHPGVQYLYGWQHFLLKWAKQFICRLETTFIPEIYPGGLIEVSSKGVVMFVESVIHTWNREGGFSTSADLIAPSTIGRRNPGMVLAG